MVSVPKTETAQREYQAIYLRYAVGLPPLPDLDFRQMQSADSQEN